MLRTDVARQFPFPEIQKTYIPEGMIWLEIAKTYKTRCVNDVFRIYYVDDDMTGETITSRGGMGAHAAGRMHFYAWLLNNNLNYFMSSPMPFLKAAVMLRLLRGMRVIPFDRPSVCRETFGPEVLFAWRFRCRCCSTRSQDVNCNPANGWRHRPRNVAGQTHAP